MAFDKSQSDLPLRVLDYSSEEFEFEDYLPSRIFNSLIDKSADEPDLESRTFDYLIEDPDYDSLEEDDDDWIQEQCHPMLDIFSILYLDNTCPDVNPHNQLGRIYMCTDVGILDIYNVDKVDETRETIKHGDEFDIMDIKGPIPFHQGSELNFDLFRGAYKGSVSGIFSDMPFYSRHEATSKNISLDRSDGTGKVVIFMGLYPHATVARVEVMLNDSVAANVYGTISACNEELGDPRASTIFFLKEKKRQIILGTQGLIPLSRSRVAVPVGSVLYLDFSLVVEGKLLEKTMSFSTRKAGVLEKSFQNLSVTVHWEAFYYKSNKEVNEGNDDSVAGDAMEE